MRKVMIVMTGQAMLLRKPLMSMIRDQSQVRIMKLRMQSAVPHVLRTLAVHSRCSGTQTHARNSVHAVVQRCARQCRPTPSDWAGEE